MPAATESAIANGDTRTLDLYHAHTHESISATYMVNGEYDQAVLDKLNWFLRDWRRDEPTKMDPRLFDVVWEVHRESGSQQPIEVMSAYRSPETNAMLRRRSRGVAEHSQHILGKAMDQHYMDVPMSRIREIGMRLQRGGVGFYPTAGTPFVHLDVGGVRHWPRMSYDQLARLFPDGKTVHIPSNGQPLAHYEEARAELESRGDGSYPSTTQLKSKGFFAWLFGGGGGGDEDEDNEAAGLRGRSGAGTRTASLNGASTAAMDVGSYGNAAKDRGAAVAVAAPAPRFSFFSQQPAAPAAPPPPAPPPAAPPPIAPERLASTGPSDAPVTAAIVPEQGPIPSLPVAALRGAPLPPRRPTELGALGPLAPLPPTRPSGLAGASPHDTQVAAVPGAGHGDAIGALLTSPSAARYARLPDVITQAAGESASSRALGYAPQGGGLGGTVPMPVARPSTLVSTHLDRSNFRSLTRPEPATTAGGRSALGAALPPLRAAARTDLGTLAANRSARSTSFQPKATELTTDRFSGQVVKPGAQAQGDSRRTSLD